ncbi:hypothetical protein ILUMI_11433 [Ignelater luminosus]|uniref:PiggyBac transposable element-derived protein domain-containing protein n=1 Tax=Ignelater luminosus TaxID=2038154 RepID=A0A8K0CW32_IGNLU|nr:hypothetical protein ILUMI_11433 [Ignelater luminosus]
MRAGVHLLSRKDYYCTDKELYEILINTDSEDEALDEGDEDDGNYSPESTDEDRSSEFRSHNNKNSDAQIDNIAEDPSALDIVEAFITESFIQLIAKQTNMYYDSCVENTPENAVKNYKPPMVDEMDDCHFGNISRQRNTGLGCSFLSWSIARRDTSLILLSVDENVGKSGNIVLTLTEPYWGNGHRLFTDNWYTSPLLYEFLFHKKINCCGTVKSNRQFMPLFEKKNVKGKVQHFSTERLVALKWTDKGDVHMLSSMHKSEMKMTKASRNKQVKKPTCFIDYNTNMGELIKQICF